jgi:hypothetical protein
MMAFRDFRKAIQSALPALLDNHIRGNAEARPLSMEGVMLQFMMHQPSGESNPSHRSAPPRP